MLTPVISIVEARTTTAATILVTAKVLMVLFTVWLNNDVAQPGTADPRAVVTADLLKATNDIVKACLCSWWCNDLPNSNGNSLISPILGCY